MTFNFAELQVGAVIVHQVPRKGDGTPVYSEIESPLNDDLKAYIKRKITGSASSSFAFPIELDNTSGSPVPAMITAHLTDPTAGFVERSRTMAEHLAKIQTRLNTAGLLTVVDCAFGGNRGLAILKLERESGVRVDQQTVGGKRTLLIEHVNRLMLTDTTKVFKVGVFQRKQGEIVGAASDHQRTQTDLARFFLSTFLGCRLVEEPSVSTRRFLDATERFINQRVSDPKAQVNYQIALAAELNSSKKQIRAKAFAQEHLATKDIQPYLDFMKEQGVGMAIDKNLALVESRLAGVQMKFKGGAVLFTPPSAIEEKTVVVEHAKDRAHVVIDDEVTSMKGSGRGHRRTAKPD